MLLQTKYFGEADCEHLLRFEKGLFGFEEEKAFYLLPFEGGGGSLLCFQSSVTPELAFVAMNPFCLKPDYAPKLAPGELKALGVDRKALIVTADVDRMLVKSAGNIPGVKTTIVGSLNSYDILNAGKLVVSVAAAEKLEEVYSK